MKCRLCSFAAAMVVSLCLVFITACQPQESTAQSVKLENKNVKSVAALKNSAKLPTITFEQVVHDFGEIAPSSYSTCTFKFKNTGENILKIERTKGTCKCTVPELKKKEYAPGESGELKVKFHAPRFQGPTSQHIFVFSNDTENARVELTIKATVMAKVKVSPESMNLSLLENNAGAKDIKIESVDGEKFAITKIISNGNVFNFDFDKNNVSNTHILTPKVDINKLRQYNNGFVVFELNHPVSKNVRFSYSSLKEFEASPSAIIIRNAVVNQPQKRTIYLTSNYNQDIVITSVDSENGHIKVLSRTETENRFVFEVEITPPTKESKLRLFSDSLTINIKGKESIRIPCRGFYSAIK